MELKQGRFVGETVKEKVNSRLSALESCLQEGKHLSLEDDDIRKVVELIFGISKFSRIMSEEERDFLRCAMIALTEQKPWG